MKVLIITQYFLPENPPGAHRLSSLAKSLVQGGHEVEVLTSFPNYPNLCVMEGYKVKFHSKELMDGYTIHRNWVYLNARKKVIHRLLNFISFSFSSTFNGLFRINRPDIIICLSPPIFTCFTSVILKWRYNCKLVLNIADLWPESGVKLGLLKNRFLIKLLTFFEEFFYNQSDGIACQTQGILSNIKKRTSCTKFIWFKNGVDFSVYEKYAINHEKLTELNSAKKAFQIGYAGLVGYAQGMEVLVRAAILLNKTNVKVSFLIVGDGPKLNDLKRLVKENCLSNFIFVGNQPKHLMPTFLSAMDITIVPLRKTDIFLGALPSKIFDSFAVKKSVLLGVDGEARELFCNKYNCAYYFEPENEFSLINQIEQIYNNPNDANEKGIYGFELMKSTFNRETINLEIIEFLKNVLERNR